MEHVQDGPDSIFVYQGQQRLRARQRQDVYNVSQHGDDAIRAQEIEAKRKLAHNRRPDVRASATRPRALCHARRGHFANLDQRGCQWVEEPRGECTVLGAFHSQIRQRCALVGAIAAEATKCLQPRT
eukprot:scaffold7352_cov254-Pinguiococcus_pyrenoidosus.AAC.15